jgi:hypothetical protein
MPVLSTATTSNYPTPTNLLGFNWDESDGNVVEFHYAIDTNIAHEEALVKYKSLLENNCTGQYGELFACGGYTGNPFDTLCFLIPCLCPCLVASSVLCFCHPCKWILFQEKRLAFNKHNIHQKWFGIHVGLNDNYIVVRNQEKITPDNTPWGGSSFSIAFKDIASVEISEPAGSVRIYQPDGFVKKGRLCICQLCSTFRDFPLTPSHMAKVTIKNRLTTYRNNKDRTFSGLMDPRGFKIAILEKMAPYQATTGAAAVAVVVDNNSPAPGAFEMQRTQPTKTARERLKDAKCLLDDGLITTEQFTAKQNAILATM